MKSQKPLIFCIIPNLNGAEFLKESIDSILGQTIESQIVVVDNASTDESVKIVESYGTHVLLIRNASNRGFTGGVNPGIKLAMEKNVDYVALFNNDARADKNWLKYLVVAAEDNSRVGIVACKLLNHKGTRFDSTGDLYSNWLLPFPRGRGEKDNGQYEKGEFVFGASAGATLYRGKMLQQIGLFDKDFFAYYEDVDISFRAQLAGWKIYYEPKAVVYHRINATSSRFSGFTAYHSMKNLPFIWLKNLPLGLWWSHLPRFTVVYLLQAVSIIKRERVIQPVLKGIGMALVLAPKKLLQRNKIQKMKSVKNTYIKSIIYPDLPPDRHKLRRIRRKIIFWRNYEDSH